MRRKRFHDPDHFGRRFSPLVAPAPSAGAAAWLNDSLLPSGKDHGTRVCSVVPLGFEAYARVLHPAYGPPPDRRPLRWAEIGERLGHVVHAETQWESLEEVAEASGQAPPWHEPPELGACPLDVLEPLREHLARHTTTPAQVYYALWIGFGDVRSFLDRAPQFTVPHREYILVTGQVDALPRVIEIPFRHARSPNLAWPMDRAWCVATEIDFRWTYVGGSADLIANLFADDRIEALRTSPEHRGDIESDWRART